MIIVVGFVIYIIIGITVARLSFKLHPKRREAVEERLVQKGVVILVPEWIIITMVALIWPLHLYEWLTMTRGEKHVTKR